MSHPDPFEAVIAKLDALGCDPRPSGSGRYQSRCPAHDDRHPSLSVSQADDGRALVHCFTGCSCAEIMNALEMSEADLFPPRERTRPAERTRVHPDHTGQDQVRQDRPRKVHSDRRSVTEALEWSLEKNYGIKYKYLNRKWIYRTADGSELLSEIRLESRAGDKTYRVYHKVLGGYLVGDPPGPLPLYRLPELKAAGRVFVTEGPKCADVAVKLGLCATTSAHGARSPGKSDWSPLAGKEVIILPDNDEPGRGYARAVVALLSRLDPPPTVKIVDLPDLPDGGDIDDWFRGGVPETWGPDECRAALVRMADEAPPVGLRAEAKAAGPDGGAKSESSGDGGVEMLCLADVQPRPVEWLWKGRIPLGNLTIIAGDPGLGKSFVTLDMAARTSCGTPWPDAPGEANPPGSVLLFTAEDDLETTVVPRLTAAGADLKKVHTITSVKSKDGPRAFTLEDLPALEEALKKLDGPRLVVIDPVGAFLGKVDDHRNAEVRGLLAPLTKLAAEHRVAVVLVTHMNKANQIKTFNKIMGSVAYTAAARSVWAVVKSKDEPKERLLLPVKSNLAPDPTGLSYRIDGDPPRVVWGDGPITLHADDFMGDAEPGRDPTELGKAREFLRRVVGPGEVHAAQVYADAASEGISKMTLKRAKGREGIESYQKAGEQGWWWRYPPGKGPAAEQGAGTEGQGLEDELGDIAWPSDLGASTGPS
jgi:hypothetical protein